MGSNPQTFSSSLEEPILSPSARLQSNKLASHPLDEHPSGWLLLFTFILSQALSEVLEILLRRQRRNKFLSHLTSYH